MSLKRNRIKLNEHESKNVEGGWKTTSPPIWIRVKEADRDFLRFLLFDDVEKEKSSIVQYRYCRLVFGLTCSPAILGETIHKHIDNFALESPQVAKILKRIYADDLLCGCETTM